MSSVLSAPSTRGTQRAYVLPPPNAPIFTVAGGGSAAPRPGRSATDVRLHPLEAAVLADGRIVVNNASDLDAYWEGGNLIAIDTDGRLAALPPMPDARLRIIDIDSERDGSLLAVTD